MSDAYETPLVLTSPHMRGQKVKDAQWLLAGHNAWHDKPSPIHTYYGPLDGEYGPATAGAARRAKYWLGYPDNAMEPIFGQLLYNLLHGDSAISEEYAKRRAARLKKALTPLKAKALDIARAEIGTDEAPFGSNCQKYGAWYGMNCVPWCAIFLSWCISHAGHPWKYSYVPNIYADAVRGRNGMSLTYHPEPGDIVTYTLHGTRDAHTAFFDGWIDSYNFHDLGGNTGPVNISNGGSVLRQQRNRSQVHSFIRLTL